MKDSKASKGRAALVFLALASVPVTVYALSGSTLTVTSWGKFGSSHYLTGGSSVAVGYNNNVSGSYSMAVGRGLNVTGSDMLAAGKWNLKSGAAHFVVGHGTGSSDKKDAVVVHTNGETEITKLKLQGDLSMGSYTSTP